MGGTEVGYSGRADLGELSRGRGSGVGGGWGGDWD